MSGSVPYDAIKNRLVTTLGGTYPVVDWEEINVTLKQGTAPFLAVDDTGGGSNLQSIGDPTSNWVLDTGAIVVHAFTPSTEKRDVTRTLCEQVRNVLRYYNFTQDGTGEKLRCLNVDPPSPGVVQDGLWNSMIAVVDFEHRYTVATSTL